MKTLGSLYSMRETAELIGNTDSRTVQLRIAQSGIPWTKVGKTIVINEAGLKKLRKVYDETRSRSRAKSA